MSHLRRVARQLGIVSVIDRIGLRRTILGATRWLADPAHRRRSRLIAADLAACRESFQRIAEGAPMGDPERIGLVVATLPTVWGLKMDAILSLALRCQGYRTVVLEVDSDLWTRRYHGLVGNRTVLEFYRYLEREPPVAVDDALAAFLDGGPSVRDLMALVLDEIEVGRIALSNHLHGNKFARFRITDPATLGALGAEISAVRRRVRAAERLLEEQRPAVVLLLEKGVSPVAEIYGACLRRGIPVVQYCGSQNMDDFVLKRFSSANRYDHPFSLDQSTWSRVLSTEWGPENDRVLLAEFEEAYRSGTWFNRKFLHQGKTIKSADEVREQLGLVEDRKTAVIFSHVLWDATFFYGEGLFEDYETWLVETIRAAAANPNVYWVVKLHPDLVWKLRLEGFDGELRDLAVYADAVGDADNIRLVPPETDISTFSFFEITDYCLTVRGTIGIEMACHGVPVLTAGTGRYSGLGFTRDSSTSNEYLARLARIEEEPPMGEEEVRRARRFAEALFQRRPWRLRSFRRRTVFEDDSRTSVGDNVVPSISSFEEFQRAEDLLRFRHWVSSNDVDYLHGAS